MKRTKWLDFMIMTALLALPFLVASRAKAQSEDLMAWKSSPVSVVFGVRSLAPETPVNNQVPFVYQEMDLPEVVCVSCESASTHWESRWQTAKATYQQAISQPERGWYVFESGLQGIGIGVDTGVLGSAAPVAQGKGNRHTGTSHLRVGLVRLSSETGAGLAGLPPAQFTRETVFFDASGQTVYAQEDTFSVRADLKVPTCTSNAGSLQFRLPDISPAWLARNAASGGVAESQMSALQLVVANCSENTRTLRIRFLPSGSVSHSRLGPDTILVGRDRVSGKESGIGYLMKFDAQGFGQRRQGVVQWNAALPLVLDNPQANVSGSGALLNRGITVSLQAFYARPENGLAIAPGEVVAKGMYQVSYE